MPEYTLASEQETCRLAEKLARYRSAGTVVALSGGLGAGKSVFARAYIRALCGADTEVPSPTFTLVQRYAIPAWQEASAAAAVYHFDLYRLESAEEVWELGLEDALAEGVCLIEWPEIMAHFLPESYLGVTLSDV